MAEKTFRCLKCDETEVKFYKDLIPYCEKHFPKPKDQAAVKAEVAQIIASTTHGMDSATEAMAVLTASPAKVPAEKAKTKAVEVKPTIAVKVEKPTKVKAEKKTAEPAATEGKKEQDWIVCAKDGEILFSGGKTKKEAQEWAQSQIAIKKLRVGQYKVSKVE
jgi:hypothetical protein